MTYFYDFIKQSTNATYLVTTREYTEKKYGSDEGAKRGALTDYHDDMKKALDNTNVNYAYAFIRDQNGMIILNDIQGEYIPEQTE